MPFDATPSIETAEQAEDDLAVLRRVRAGLGRSSSVWMKGYLGTGGVNRPHCLLGWLIISGSGTDMAYRMATQYILPVLPPYYLRDDLKTAHEVVVSFNDAYEIGYRHVVDVVDRAIARAERHMCP